MNNILIKQSFVTFLIVCILVIQYTLKLNKLSKTFAVLWNAGLQVGEGFLY